MPNREHHQQAAELHDKAAHAHRAAASSHQMQDHQTGNELTRRALEHSQLAYRQTSTLQGKIAHHLPIAMFSHQDIASHAHKLWLERGSPSGSPDIDWAEASRQLRAIAELNL